MRHSHPPSSPAAAVLLAAAVATVSTCASSPPAPQPAPFTTPTPAPISEPPPGPAVPLDPGWSLPQRGPSGPRLASMVDVVKAVTPSVVAVNVQHITYLSLTERVQHLGAGSGWVIDPDGLIVTNNHVVVGAQEVSVTLDNGRIYPARQIARDPTTDLAVIKIDASGLTAARLGRSADLEVGMPVAALGNALGRGIGMTGGWVSRLGTSITEAGRDTLYDLIETDAAINPGNSGGPLANMAGEVVGITNAKLVASNVEGIGYAISIDWALPIIQQLVRTGTVIRPWLGLTFHTVTVGLAERFSLAVDQGALVTEVAPGSPAAKADLHAGNVIIAIDGRAISTATDAARAIEGGTIGEPMAIDYWQGQYHGTKTLVPVADPNS